MDKQLGKFEKSSLLVRGAWRSLILDKKLAIIALLAIVVNLLAITIIAMVGYLNPWGMVYSTTGSSINDIAFNINFKPLGVVLFMLIGLITSAIGALGMGAVTHGAIERFKGNSPTIKDSLRVAWKRKKSLLGFVLFSYIIGYIINQIASRIPYFGGIIIAWLAGAAWGIASFFSIPIIIEGKESIGPITATKKSMSIMKQIWGESLVLTIGIGAFQLIVVLIYAAFVMVGAMFIGLLGNTMNSLLVPLVILGGVALLILFAIVFVFSLLEIFVKAALYYYATTGESPATFDKNILRQAFTPKKAKKVFSI